MKIKIIFILSLSLYLLNSCSIDNPYIEAIKGEWECVSWTANGTDRIEDGKSKVGFTFSNTDAYISILNGAKTEGTYKIKENKLYTIAKDDDLEIMVKITKLTEEDLVFEMNRAGEKEVMTFIKIK